MKLVTAVVTPTQFDAIHKALNIFGIAGLTLSEVFQRDITIDLRQIYRGQRVRIDLFPHIRIDLIAPDHEALDVAHIIATLTSIRDYPAHVRITSVEKPTTIRTGKIGLDPP